MFSEPADVGRYGVRSERFAVKLQIKSVAVGFALASLLIFGAVAGLFWFADSRSRPVFHDQVLPSGKTVKVTSFNLAWGVEHDERRAGDDTFALEYVSTVPHTDEAALDMETLEVFELIRPASEQWGFKSAQISAFPTTQRKGKYYIYVFKRGPEGKWTFTRNSAKVFVND